MTQTKDPHSISHNISQLLKIGADTVSKIINLAVLESRLAGISLMSILGLILIGSLLTATAWFLLLIIIAIWLISHDFNVISALLSISLLNLLLLIPLTMLIKRYWQKLFFPATRRQLLANNASTTEL